MSTVEDIQKAERDVELLQRGLDKVGVALREAEKVALLGERVKRRAPVIALAVAAVAAIAVGAVMIRRRRQHQAVADDPGAVEGMASGQPSDSGSDSF
jgi:hypothetical protein